MTPTPPAAVTLRRATLALALGWCAAFPVVALGFSLHLFADGSLFAYAVAADDAWSFHWRNISGRVFPFVATYAPAQAWVRVMGDPAGGVAIYGALHYLAPAASLAATWLADRSEGRVFLAAAATSTALLLPFVFGFPTEMWIAHAAFWPALALLHGASGFARHAATVGALAALALSHEGGVVWATAAVATLALRPRPFAATAQGVVLLALALLPWAAMKLLARPEPYVAEVLGRNALNFIDLRALATPLTGLMAVALMIYAVACTALRRRPRATLAATALTAALLSAWWAGPDPFLHAWDRYYLRTLILGAVPILAIVAALVAHGAGRRVTEALPASAWSFATGALAVATLVHAVETAKFAAAFAEYKAAVGALAVGEASDPALGDAAFVSAARLGERQRRLGWHSTTPFLSALAAPGYAPRRLVVDPTSNYFWLSCETATRNAAAERALPAPTRALIRSYSCLHR